MKNLDQDLIKSVITILRQAGEIALGYYKTSKMQIWHKLDGTPVTNADLEVSQFIVQKLEELTPDIFTVSEENEHNQVAGHTFWLLDPIDGTKHYINGSSGYTINLALVDGYKAKLGFVYHPSLGEIYYNDAHNNALCYDVFSRQITARITEDRDDKIKVLVDVHQENLAKIQNNPNFIQIFPTGHRNKISMLLTNQIDVYYLHRTIMEWDTAAGHAILNALGGGVMDCDGNELVYGKPLFYNCKLILCSQKALKYKQQILENN